MQWMLIVSTGRSVVRCGGHLNETKRPRFASVSHGCLQVASCCTDLMVSTGRQRCRDTWVPARVAAERRRLYSGTEQSL